MKPEICLFVHIIAEYVYVSLCLPAAEKENPIFRPWSIGSATIITLILVLFQAASVVEVVVAFYPQRYRVHHHMYFVHVSTDGVMPRPNKSPPLYTR